jgi:hypothetical protein
MTGARWRTAISRFALVTAVCGTLGLTVTSAADGAPGARAAGPAVEVSGACAGQNAEAEQAADGRYVYETWIGCGGIGFARSADGGHSFGHPLTVPGSKGSGRYRSGLPKFGWDPAIAVAPNHDLYLSYMIERHGIAHPVVAVSVNRGASFSRVQNVMPPNGNNWGDRDFIAVSQAGTIYLTWDFGVSIRTRRANAVIQVSTDGGRTWSHIIPVSPGYPSHGGDAAAPLVTEPGGRIDVLLWVEHDPGVRHYALPPGHDYFTSSVDGGETWSRPVAVGPSAGRIGKFVTWIDASIGADPGGTLYAAWDTQAPGGDTGWLSYSTDHGRTWSPARRATPGHDTGEHIMAVIGGRPGVAWVAWLSDSAPHGFAPFLRPFSVRSGWLAKPMVVSREDGNRNVWPGDTIGLSMLGHTRGGAVKIMLSWGSAVSHRISEVWAAAVTRRMAP